MSFMSITPDSWNSSHKSLPSRVRSPTPANTDTPPCFMAMLLISSMMMTVLPTPAPPNRPILPPCRYGSSRSMTLMPVSNIFNSVDCCSSVGAEPVNRPMLFRLDRTDPGSRPARRARSARGRASAGPTGTEIAAPVSITAMPRCRPSVGFIATVRTRFSPRCCSLRRRCLSLLTGRGASSRHDPERVVERSGGSARLELDVDDGADDLNDLADVCCCAVAICFSLPLGG